MVRILVQPIDISQEREENLIIVSSTDTHATASRHSIDFLLIFYVLVLQCNCALPLPPNNKNKTNCTQASTKQ
jgi:hypothetical protein